MPIFEFMGRRARRHRLASGAALIIASGAIVWSGCDVDRNHGTLSFFFDGVPEPAPTMVDGAPGSSPFGRASRVSPGGAVSAHSAYLERRCTECHGERARFGFTTDGFANMGADTCIDCHEPALDMRLLHGPVAIGECLMCHEAHVSANPLLLIEPSPALCLACHDQEMLAEGPTPHHADLARDCLDCHHGHGGDEPYFLRPPEPEG